MNKITKSILFFIAVLLLAIVIAKMCLWISITTQYDTFEQIKQAYLQHFPPALREARLLTAIALLMLACSIFIFVQAILRNFLKIPAIALAGLSCLLFAWNLFSLM